LRGWWGKLLWVDLSRNEYRVVEYPKEIARDFVGGRGFAIKLLWDYLEPGTDPLSPSNMLIVAVGSLTGFTPSGGKAVVAAKSPLTGGYGDGNIGTRFAIALRKSGFDAVVIVGKARRPSYVYIEDGKCSILSAEGLWGLTTFETERKLVEVHGRDCGVLCIGPAGEHLVKYAVVISQEGRAGGRPGIGAVMGSKNLKAIVVRGTLEPPVADPSEQRKVFAEAVAALRSKKGYGGWMRWGTMAAVEWSQKNSVLPTTNFREGVFDEWELMSAKAMEAFLAEKRSCPLCPMPCGNVVIDVEGRRSEIDYENVAMLGSNLAIPNLGRIAVLNRLADELGIDTISLGSCLAFAMEATERGLIPKGEGIEWGDYKRARELVQDIANRRGLGDLLAEGVERASQKLGGGSEEWAMHVKGLPISAYDCHAAPGMALAYGTSPIGAHHKDSWVISWEVEHGRLEYSREKVEKVIELQRIRGGIFETLVACRLPWVELGLELDYYMKLFRAVTGVEMTLSDYYRVADRIYTLIRAFWIRERGEWSYRMDVPPARWFKDPLTRGPFKGCKLDLDRYLQMLRTYYEIRGWDENGVPRESTLRSLGLDYVVDTLRRYVEVKP